MKAMYMFFFVNNQRIFICCWLQWSTVMHY